MKTEFDEKAATWDEDPSRVARAETIGSIIKERINLSEVNSALEYGSGTGLLSQAMKDELKDVVLMDESEEMTRVAKAKFRDLQLEHFKPVLFNLMKEKLPNDRFDLIYILLTLHHVNDYERLLDKFSSLLNPGGHLAIIDLETEDGSFHEGEFFGHKGFDKCILKGKLEEVGMTAKSYEVCYEIEKVDEAGNKRLYPLFLMIAQKS